MKPVYQTIFTPGEGDCFSACLASVLEIPLDKVPKFRRDNSAAPLDMMDAAQKWLKKNFGLTIVGVRMPSEECGALRFYNITPGTVCLASGKSPNFENCRHAVVGCIDKAGMNFVMTHDPNPSGKGISGAPEIVYFLVPIDPARTIKANFAPSNI